MQVTPAQLRAGRELLGLTRAEFAERLGLSLIAIRLAEDGRGSTRTVATIQTALEVMGIDFHVEVLAQ